MDNEEKRSGLFGRCRRGVSPRLQGEVPAATRSPFLTRAATRSPSPADACPAKRDSHQGPSRSPLLARAPHQARFSPSRQESRSVRGRLVAFALGEEVSAGIAPGVAISVALGLGVVPAATRSANPADAHRTKPESRRISLAVGNCSWCVGPLKSDSSGAWPDLWG